MGRKSNIEKSEAEAEIYEPMDFDEITRRLRNGADIQTLADLHGWGYTKMVQRLQYFITRFSLFFCFRKESQIFSFSRIRLL